MRGPNEPNGWVEYGNPYSDEENETRDVEVGVRSALKDGHVELTVTDPETNDQILSVFVDGDGGEYRTTADSAAHELAEHIEKQADR